MTFIKHDAVETFGADTLEILLENEVQNNLLVSFILREADKSSWLFAAVKDGAGSVVLTAAWTGLPYNIVLYETGNTPNDGAIKLLAGELKALGVAFPGVLAEQGLAKRFAEVWADGYRVNFSMNIMRLDAVSDHKKAPGSARLMCEEDLFYTPYWEYIFRYDCHVETYDIPTCAEHCKSMLGSAFIWEDGHPVSMAASERKTQNGAGIGFVYTPPQYRGRGYAASNVACLSRDLLERGHKFCFLVADAANPTSCGIYRKIGYQDLCVYDDIKF
ncbi:MAG: GNAT family N-acetyltransferase [Oscillospiraceae bacterium]|jgi:GNAT superfamily N-acetyltransferase|nr:GNAT family N-acetyltransferase [Oscillospiraceae bacterium]